MERQINRILQNYSVTKRLGVCTLVLTVVTIQ